MNSDRRGMECASCVNDDIPRWCQVWFKTRFERNTKTKYSLVVHGCIQNVASADDPAARRSAGCTMRILMEVLDSQVWFTIPSGSSAESLRQNNVYCITLFHE